MVLTLVAAAAAMQAASHTPSEALARQRGLAVADALQAGAELPRLSPRISFSTYFRPEYRREPSDAAKLRTALAGCRREDVFVHVYGVAMQYVALRYSCPAHRGPDQWPVLEMNVDNGAVSSVLLATGPRQLERSKISQPGPRFERDSSFAADRAAALGLISALQAGKPRLPKASPTLVPRFVDNGGGKPVQSPDGAVLRQALAGCRPGNFEAEPRRWLGSRLAIVPFSCPPAHKPHPEMTAVLELLDGRVNGLRLEAGLPPPPIVARPAPR